MSHNANDQVKASKEDAVKDHRYMRSDVTLYRNGKLVIQTRSWSRKSTGGLKGQTVFVVAVDDKGNAIWVSQVHKLRTVGGRKDPTTASDRTDTNSETWPEVIARHTKSIDIYHSAGDLSQSRESQKRAILESAQAIKEIKEAFNDI